MLADIVNALGENAVLVSGGILIGIVFGAMAQQSRFCLRAAAVEFSRGGIGQKTAIWLMVFTTAVTGTSLLAAAGIISLNEARQLATPQSLSGALIGGLMFGTGMVLSGGCASRLLVLSATGNLRALLSGLVFAVVAQASLRGVLSPAREWIAGGATTLATGGNNLIELSGIDPVIAILIACVATFASVATAIYAQLSPWRMIAAAVVGATVPAAWWFSYAMQGVSFEPVQMNAISFTGPSADALMAVLTRPVDGYDFNSGLVPGVFIGAFLAAFLTRELQLKGFEGGANMRRYLTGAALMGFGGMLAGGCAVGAGVTGASVFAMTAWITLFAIWISAALTDFVIDRRAGVRPEMDPMMGMYGSGI